MADPADWMPLADAKAQPVVCLRCGLLSIDDDLALSLHASMHFMLDRLAQRIVEGWA